MSTLRWLHGDVRDRLADIPDQSVDLVVTSPPFLALRSYLPADHPDKGREIGSRSTPADFLDTLLALTAEWGRVLAPHGSICVELGDTYSGSGGAGGDYNPGGLREGQDKFEGSGYIARQDTKYPKVQRDGMAGGGKGWPLAKSLTGIPTLYPWSLAYGRNLLTGQPSPAGQWRIRNIIVWGRPNPPVGALGDKFRPATSYITVACRGPKRWFDLDAVRTDSVWGEHRNRYAARYDDTGKPKHGSRTDGGKFTSSGANPAGAPPLDWHQDVDGDWLWKLATAPYPGAHYATYPLTLPLRLIEAMCPREVCRVCGKARERVTSVEHVPNYDGGGGGAQTLAGATGNGVRLPTRLAISSTTLGWTDCGHGDYRPGVVLDPFVGSGTTLTAAALCGRDAIGIDLDTRNIELARQRISGQVRIVTETDDEHGVTWTTERVTATQLAADARGQAELWEMTHG